MTTFAIIDASLGVSSGVLDGINRNIKDSSLRSVKNATSTRL